MDAHVAVFSALGDRNRCRMVERLSTTDASISQLAQEVAISLPATLKHLRVLEDAGLVSRTKHGRTELVVTQHVPAPVEKVWSAWTSAEGWRRWWWPHWTDTVYQVDPCPGGRWLARSAEGGAGVEGEFVTIEEPHLLELTWRWDGEGPQDHSDSGSPAGPM